jgi:hypothetical protein
MTKALKHFLRIKPTRLFSVPRGLNAVQAIGLVLAQLLDASTTAVGLRLGAVEQNGTMARVIEGIGLDGFFAVKLAAAVFFIWYTWRKPVAAWVISSVYFTVALWNLVVIYRLAEVLTIV